MHEHQPKNKQPEQHSNSLTRESQFPGSAEVSHDPDASTSSEDFTERVRSSLQRIFNRQLPLQDETSYFILVNVLDIVMTNFLMHNRGAEEANPLALYILIRWGFGGMIAFKMFLVAFICVLAQVIARRSMRHARFVLIAGTAIVGCVVVYSVLLGFKWLG